MTQSPQEQPTRVECPPAKDPAVRAFIMAALLIGFGAWCFMESTLLNKYPCAPFDFDNMNPFLSWATNFFGQFIFTGAGLCFVIWAIRHLTRRLVADEEGIGYAGGTKVPWQAIARIDATQLPRKDFLTIAYGRKREFKIRAWRVRNFRQLVVFIDAHVPPEKIRR